VGEVDVALNKAGETVKETSASADKILKDVVTATQSMTATSKESLTTFEDFMVKESGASQANIGVHFKALDEHFTAQKTVISGVSNASKQVISHLNS
jgi:hypothetical protein